MPDLNEELRAYGAALAARLDEDGTTYPWSGSPPRRPRRLALAALGVAAAVVSVVLVVSAARATKDETVVSSSNQGAGAPADPTPPSSAATDRPGPTCAVPDAEPSAGEVLVSTFFHCGPADPRRPLVSVERAVPATGSAVQEAVEELMAGANPQELAAGLTSGVPDAAVGAPVQVSIDGAGVATVEVDYDFSTVDNFSTSSVTLAFVEPLWATVLQFDTVTAVDLGQFCAATELDCDALSRAQIEDQLDRSVPADVEQLVRFAFDALAAGDWDAASAYFFAGGPSVGDPTIAWGDEVDELVAAEPDLVASGDVAAMLEAWCGRFSGACAPVAEVVAIDSTSTGDVASVRLRSPDGATVRFRDGTDVARLSIGSFEGQRWIADLPPRRGD